MDRTQKQADPQEQPAGTPGAPARIVILTSGDFTLTVNPVDGSEIEPHRPGTETGRPAKRDEAARRARDEAARPPALPGPPLPATPLLERTEERERLVRLLGRGRSVRLTGPSGSGRTALLDEVATACEGIAPDGVVRLSGRGYQQPLELLYALYATVYEAAAIRPDRIDLLARVRDIGAVVLLDDLEFGGSALDELLRATPECAYLLAATPDTRAPSDDSHLEEVFLGGLGKADCLHLLEAGIGRPLTDAETAWAGDLRFASEGLPLRFVQAAALLRQRDELNHAAEDDDEEEPGVFEERPRDTAQVPLPTLAEGAAPAELLASRVSESARAALRIACALGGELPHHAHLPALLGDTHADTAVAELLGCGLLTPVGARYRLAAGVARQLEEAGYGESAPEEARTAARHYAWWTGHTSVTPERVAAEADAVLAALAGADVVAAVLLARTAAPAFAASLRWEAWERVLRAGSEAARKAGEVAEQAYFHHELGVLALCEGRLDRARAELEASIGLRGALADKRGTVAGRRALALVTDRETAAAGAGVSPPLRLEPPLALPAGPEAGTRPLPVTGPAAGAVAAGSTSAVTAPLPAAAVTKVTPVTPAAPAALAKPVTPVKPVTSAKPGAPAKPGTPAKPVSSVVPMASVAPVVPVAPDGPLDAVNPVATVVPVDGTGPGAPGVRRPETPTTLSQVFEDAFPITPKPAPEPAPAAGPPRRSARRRPALLAAAGVLTVVALGTVVSLTTGSSDEPQPPAHGPSSSPTPKPLPPQVAPSSNGNDSAPEEPTDAAEPAEAPEQASDAPVPGRTAVRTPSQRPSPTPVKPAPTKPGSPKPTQSSPDPTVSQTPPVTETPAPTPTPTEPPVTTTNSVPVTAPGSAT
ncbi:ATP-binding protein [Streptomyces xanthophaeus]|uniref:ATP-binding protein n=1 Tax=Streptomyces xanthophaeus TaxID=67385 RepID=UPI00386F1EF2|nr:ATP-binding protein [Streptomyces xanthophaeus]WST60313.1 ATP-binding protein [Streptomyces xanthophaeus]